MKKCILFVCTLFLILNVHAQEDFIKFESNKVLCLFSFLETSSGKQGTSSSFRQLIRQNFQEDEDFQSIIEEYSNLNFNYSSEKQEYPESRHNRLNTIDLLWIAASNSSDIDDFNIRIIGFLPQRTQVKLINSLRNIEPYYNKLVWDEESENIVRIMQQLTRYKANIAETYWKISAFYNTKWDTNTPFKVMLYPIPLNSGNTTAIPMGNALICGFLSHSEQEYTGLLGIIIHEMCHILYGEQTPKVQHEMDQWFSENNSPFAKLAYNYIDEGLATVLGNGWAYEQIHGEIDTADWYNDAYINGFAKALFPLVSQYMKEGKSIDKQFVDKSIDVFATRFPKAIYETKILMNAVQLFANTEEEAELDFIVNEILSKFNIRSMWLSSPINDKQSAETFSQDQTTKVFIIHSENEKTIDFLNQKFSAVSIATPANSMDVLMDEETSSAIIVINIDTLDKLEAYIEILDNTQYIDFGKNYKK